MLPASTILDLGNRRRPAHGYDDLVSATQLILEDNGPLPTLAIMAPRTWADFARMKDGDGLALRFRR